MPIFRVKRLDLGGMLLVAALRCFKAPKFEFFLITCYRSAEFTETSPRDEFDCELTLLVAYSFYELFLM